ncbi:hypothetical protein [Fibrobacter sp. UWH9]|uniref:hypothetical protein n=1 Tax=Fibrobacter sp. UWH9 TaxID=1896213 RepID=UPI001114B725|nr:hypothetical protein [Fibrobacter sp. UWH9]
MQTISDGALPPGPPGSCPARAECRQSLTGLCPLDPQALAQQGRDAGNLWRGFAPWTPRPLPSKG